MTWQGQFGDFAQGNTILEGIQATVSPETAVTYTPDGTGAAGADVAVVVVGEIPYAEWHGDAGDGYHPWKLYRDDLETIANVKASGTPVVVVLISGRPLDIHDELDKWDALLAVWLPGTQGEGVADVLFGAYNPTGKLSYTWPETQDDIPIHSNKSRESGVLFPYGFGLRY